VRDAAIHMGVPSPLSTTSDEAAGALGLSHPARNLSPTIGTILDCQLFSLLQGTLHTQEAEDLCQLNLRGG
jgi:hypothetical protein